MSETQTEARVGVLEHRVGSVERLLSEAIGEIRDGIQEIAANTGKLAILEERHAETRNGLERAFDAIGKCEAQGKDADTRLRVIEVVMPGLRETRKWVVGGILTICGMVGAALIGLVLVR